MHLHLLNILENDNSTTIHNRNLHLLVIEIVKNGLSPACMNEIFVGNPQHYDLRKKKLNLGEITLRQCTTELKL